MCVCTYVCGVGAAHSQIAMISFGFWFLSHSLVGCAVLLLLLLLILLVLVLVLLVLLMLFPLLSEFLFFLGGPVTVALSMPFRAEEAGVSQQSGRFAAPNLWTPQVVVVDIDAVLSSKSFHADIFHWTSFVRDER